MLSHLFKIAIPAYTHRLCALCGLALTPEETHWCQHCCHYFEPQFRCQRCGLPMQEMVIACGQCLIHPPLWNRLFCIGDYTFPLSHYIHQIKHQRQFWKIPPITELLVERIPYPAPLLTYVPLHWRRQSRRGFNQSEQIARTIAKHTTSEVQGLFQRLEHTRPQQGLSRSERHDNLKHAFKLIQHPEHKHVAIVDDVVTTGTTVEELCELLLEVGVEYIDIYCLSRTPDRL